ncbi:MAG: RNA polymerase, sigma 54 subunit, RpoN [Bacteroidetes bacterium]|nr:RNA polymerase, sigma 54 subunit, RpoN [Bacteroidota bacterium]
MINLSQQLRLGLRLTPQQVQYLKLLQLPTLALELRIKTELEINPVLETSEETEETLEQEEPAESAEAEEETKEAEDTYTLDDYLNDEVEGHKSNPTGPTTTRKATSRRWSLLCRCPNG